MKTFSSLAFIALAFSVGPVTAQQILPDAIETSSLASIAAEPPATASSDPDPAIVHLQVLLDRAGASPGVIDGFYGDNVSKAVAGLEAIRGLSVDGKVGANVAAQLEDKTPIMARYVISQDDAAGLVPSIPNDYGEKAKMESMGYTSVAEKLSERFHMDIGLIQTLNPNAKFQPGETINVVTPGAAKEGSVKRIEVRKNVGQVVAYAEDGSVLAVYPATIGSEDNPSPSGTHKVKGVARMPTYRYDPKLNFKQGKNSKVLTIPKGPNGPVGSVWIDLTEPTYGIHGTPEPELIGKSGSHGCVRLTNWDAEELAAMVKPGVVVNFAK